MEDSKANGSNRIAGPVCFKIPVKAVTTADTVAARAATSIDTVPELELDVAWLGGNATLSEMAIDVAVEDRSRLAIGVVPEEASVEERLLRSISYTE